ncbi:hypothetical protein Goe16_01540 [Bacillus phage vB_BsuM-Goe16]|nr:hypothetical protein Goe16_01540 [Bacillus phage vB_BsuM-Goe16]
MLRDKCSYYVELICDGDRWTTSSENSLSYITLRGVTTVQDMIDQYEWVQETRKEV